MQFLVAVGICATLGIGCEAGAPDLKIIQAAYDRELSAGSTLHDKDLKLLEAKCEDRRPDGSYLCQVTFISAADPSQRLYFDIAAVAPVAKGWELKSGLCRR